MANAVVFCMIANARLESDLTKTTHPWENSQPTPLPDLISYLESQKRISLILMTQSLQLVLWHSTLPSSP